MSSVEGKRAEKSRDIIRLDTHVTYGVSMTHHYTALQRTATREFTFIEVL